MSPGGSRKALISLCGGWQSAARVCQCVGGKKRTFSAPDGRAPITLLDRIRERHQAAALVRLISATLVENHHVLEVKVGEQVAEQRVGGHASC